MFAMLGYQFDPPVCGEILVGYVVTHECFLPPGHAGPHECFKCGVPW